MKIQIIQLQTHDDVISARDKITWSKAARILLVWPKNSRILTRQFDLVLLRRCSTASGAQLGLVTRDNEVCALAAALGIPAFPSIGSAQRSYWRHSRNKANLPDKRYSLPELRSIFQQVKGVSPEWKGNIIVRVGSFILGLLAVCSLVIAFVPAAKVTILPPVKMQQIVLKLSANDLIKAPGLTESLPLRHLVIEVDGKDSLPSTGETEIPLNPATGYALFNNFTDREVVIPSGTVVIASSYGAQRFSTTQSARISARAQKTLPIQAVLPGQNGNLPAGAIDAIDGLLGLSLSVTNTFPTTDGTSRLGSAVRQVDWDALENKLKQTLLQTAQAHVSAQLKKEDLVILNSLTLRNLVLKSANPQVGQPGDVLTISLSAECLVSYLSGDDLAILANTALNANLPGGYQPINSSLKLIPLDDVVVQEDGSVQWSIQAERTLEAVVNKDQVQAQISGLSRQDAIRNLRRGLNLASNPEIIVNPGWWPRLPFLPLRISIAVQEIQ